MKSVHETTFYKHLIELTKERGKSVNQVERELGYPRNSLNGYKYNRMPSAIRLLELSKYYGVSPEYLMGESISPHKKSAKELYNLLSIQEKREILYMCQREFLTEIDGIVISSK